VLIVAGLNDFGQAKPAGLITMFVMLADAVKSRLERFYDRVSMDAKYSEDDDDEQSLESYVAFQRFEKVFEEVIEAFLGKEKVRIGRAWVGIGFGLIYSVRKKQEVRVAESMVL